MLWLLVNIRFQVLFHSPPGVLFTFPSRYCSTIGHQVVFRLGGWSPLLPTGFHVSGGTLDSARYSSVSFTGLLPSLAHLPRWFYYNLRILNAVRNPQRITTLGLASSPFARRYSGNLFWFLFLRLLRCFSSAGLPWYDYFIHHIMIQYCCIGFPHSDICGSMDICSSPQLFAACHVLLRLLMPRHSSYALIRLTLPKNLQILWFLFFQRGSNSFLRTIFLDSLISFEFHYVSKSFFYCFFVLFRYLSRFRSFLVTLFYLKKPFLFSYSFFYSVLKTTYMLCLFRQTSDYDVWKVHSEKTFDSHLTVPTNRNVVLTLFVYRQNSNIHFRWISSTP